MVAPEQLHQMDIRRRQAKEQIVRPLGGLAMFFAGEFLQLPPVHTHSLADCIDDAGRWLQWRVRSGRYDDTNPRNLRMRRPHPTRKARRTHTEHAAKHARELNSGALRLPSSVCPSTFERPAF